MEMYNFVFRTIVTMEGVSAEFRDRLELLACLHWHILSS
jgi:hypothetical protein